MSPAAITSPPTPHLPLPAAWNVALQHANRAINAIDSRPVAPINTPTSQAASAIMSGPVSYSTANAQLASAILATPEPSHIRAIPTARLSAASSDAVDAVRILQASLVSSDPRQAFKAESAIKTLASGAGLLAVAPTDAQVAEARQHFVRVADIYSWE